MICQYCSKEYTNRSGFSNHTRRCPSNPNRIMEVMSPEARAKISIQTSEGNKRKWADPIIKETHRRAMKLAVKNNPDSYTSSNRGRTKQIVVDGIKLQGQWEVDFYMWAKEKGLEPQRPTIAFKYEWDGERLYHPDFYIPSLDLYVEVKGYETDRDRAKWLHFPAKLRIIKLKEIQEIRKGCFVRL